MKRELLLITILAIIVCILCGCTHKSEDRQNIENSDSSITSSEIVSNNKEITSKTQTDDSQANDEKKSDNSNTATSEYPTATDTCATEHKENNIDKSDNGTSSQVENDEVYEAEIDFSELE